MRWILLLVLSAGLMLGAACEEQDEGRARTSDSSTSSLGYSEDDPEYQLAVLDADGFVDYDDPSIDAYARALDKAEGKCKDERRHIGDYAVRARQLLAEDGIEVTLLEVVRGIDLAVPAEIAPANCDEIVALLVVLMKNQ